MSKSLDTLWELVLFSKIEILFICGIFIPEKKQTSAVGEKNAFVRSDGKICSLYALEDETLKKLYSASQEEWNKIFECSSHEVKILLADGKAVCWEIKKEELGCNPMVVNIRQEQPQTQVKQRRNPWWKFWLS